MVANFSWWAMFLALAISLALIDVGLFGEKRSESRGTVFGYIATLGMLWAGLSLAYLTILLGAYLMIAFWTN